MPRKQRAQYHERKIWIDRCLEYITPNQSVIWIGRSLGALFLAKYLSENLQKVDQLHLISGIYYPGSKEKYTDNKFPCGFNLSPWREKTLEQYSNIRLRHSTDDQIVSYTNSDQLSQALNSDHHTLHTLENRWHLRQPNFPELRKSIRASS
jgi:predicted alpha/beta hydrolase family esterase